MSTTNRSNSVHRSLHLLAMAGLVLAGAATLTFGVSNTAAAFASGEQRPDLTVMRTSAGDFGGLLPGGHARLTFHVSADVDVLYAFDASMTGTGPLAGQLHARVSSASGEILYAGPLNGAAFSGRALAAGELDQIIVDVELPLETTAGGAAGSANMAARFTAARP